MRVSFDFVSNVVYKCSRFSMTLLKESFEFVLCESSNPVLLNLNLVLLSAEVNLILEEQNCKRDALVACGIGCIEIIFTMLTKVVTFYIQAFIIQVGLTGLKVFLLRGGVCLAKFLVFDK